MICNFCHKEIDENSETILFSWQESQTICSDCIKYLWKKIQQTSPSLAEKTIAINDLDKNTSIENIFNLNSEVKTKESNIKRILKPKEIRKLLDEYVIGQEKTKDIISTAVYNHYKTTLFPKNNNVELEKSNILLLGPTGSGKTYIARTLAKIVGVPFTVVDSTGLTEAGFVGADVESCLKSLIDNAEGDISKAEHGIIYLDEFDKLSRKSENVSITRDVGGEGVQQALLKLIEGAIVDVPCGQRKHPNESCMKINTANILFICGGSFEGIEKIIEKRLGITSRSIGFGSEFSDKKKCDLGDVVEEVKTEDLKKFGIIPEMIGRLPIICTLHDLDINAYIKILTEPRNALCKQYQALFEYDNVNLSFDDDAIAEIANLAITKHVGVRGLRSIMENILSKYMYEIPDNKIASIHITKEYVLGLETDANIKFMPKTSEL